MRYVGPAGQAAQVKALVNMVMNINTAGLAEGLALGDALGLDLTCCARCSRRPAPTRKCSRPTARTCRTANTTCFFSAAHAAKDSGIALEARQGAGPEAAARRGDEEAIRPHGDEGLGELDKSGIAELTFKGRASG